MTPSMPIATDNIYKFATLFGLAIIISVILATAYFPEKHLELAFNNYLEIEMLKGKENLSQEELIRRKVLEEKDEAMAKFLGDTVRILAVFALIGTAIFFWGGICWWRKVQPKQDTLLNLQIEKTRREIQVLEKQLEQKKEE